VHESCIWRASHVTTRRFDAPSDRQSAPYLGGFRQTTAHVEDVKAVIAWLRQEVTFDMPRELAEALNEWAFEKASTWRP
jgi:hypothetical protein